MAVYRSYCQCREMADREAQQLKRYEVLKDAFDMQKEHVRELTEDTEFIEHVARERMQVADKNEILFRFE
jgi:cell division protein FtsB